MIHPITSNHPAQNSATDHPLPIHHPTCTGFNSLASAINPAYHGFNWQTQTQLALPEEPNKAFRCIALNMACQYGVYFAHCNNNQIIICNKRSAGRSLNYQLTTGRLKSPYVFHINTPCLLSLSLPWGGVSIANHQFCIIIC